LSTDISPPFEQWVRSRIGEAASIEPVARDASRRFFFRVRTASDSLIVMDSGRIPMDSWLDINALLRSHGFPVPAVLHADSPAGWAVMEDLGDVRLLDLDRQGYFGSLGEALEILERMQRELTPVLCADSIAGKRHFTATFFMAELDHTLEHLFFRLLAVPPEDVTSLQTQFRDLCTMVAEGPRVFTHRDYHSANLMVKDGRIVMVDWQDARFGPPEYDLVSLLRDSYVDSGPEWEAMARRFVQANGRSNMFKVAACACQRSLKAAGTFAFQFRAFEREDYLENLPRTLRYLENYAVLCPRLRPLVNHVHSLLDSCTGEIDLRGFRESDKPIIIGTGS
jgi:aminoglycoside/choline kinase family phosphotransferase